jgi:sporulation protein YabP
MEQYKQRQEPTKQETAMPHNLILEGRNSLSVTGVRRVVRCEPDSAQLETTSGILHLAGAQLSVTALDLERGEAKLSGRVDALEYTEDHTASGLLRRLLR